MHGTNYHLLGDGGYTLAFRIMVPFRRDHEFEQVLNREIRFFKICSGHLYFNFQYGLRFNAALSRNRQKIERVFAWKEKSLSERKIQRLRTCDVKNLYYFNNMIVAACCLHNLTLDLLEPENEGDQPDDFNEENDLDEDLIDDEELDKRPT